MNLAWAQCNSPPPKRKRKRHAETVSRGVRCIHEQASLLHASAAQSYFPAATVMDST